MVVVKERDGTPVSIRMGIKEFLSALTEYDSSYPNEVVFDNGCEKVYIDLGTDRFSYLEAEGDSVEITTDIDWRIWYDGYNAHTEESDDE